MSTVPLDGQVRSELARVLPEFGAAPVGTMNEARFRQAVVQALLARPAPLASPDWRWMTCTSPTRPRSNCCPQLAASCALALAVRGAEIPTALAGMARR